MRNRERSTIKVINILIEDFVLHVQVAIQVSESDTILYCCTVFSSCSRWESHECLGEVNKCQVQLSSS